ncbi:probable protein phosphatase 2C 5 isoform X4 [Asparagus officinalis]|uniref:probable protein phosphatase 2C 5 isoform X4 n=1 Tax=Asparagus officinalis TaxID=4686 RepID=UPI00098E3A11|nr:probable protein phosphatase 2C 5 isoform X4 [Asparagus officinalis]
MAAALLSPQLQRSLPNLGGGITSVRTRRTRPRQCSAIAVDVPSSLAGGVSGVRWGSSSVQGRRSEMEDDVVLRSDGLDGFAFAAVFDGHAGFSSVEFLRDELYNECVEVLQGGLLLTSKNFDAIKAGIAKAFETVDKKLLTWLEQIGKDVDSGATATVMFLGKGVLIISHVISRTGKAEILTGPHRPYGNNRVSLEEVKRIRAAGGWIVDGRICGDISVSRAFGDIRFKTKKNEMLKKGVEEGRWTEKFISRIRFKDDLVTSSPDIYQLDLGSDVEFILLASDGLWDYMKSSDAVTFVRNQLRQHGDVQLACEALAQATLDRQSQDNISIVIADLGRTDWQSVPPQGPNFFYEMSQAFATVGIVSLGIWISSFLLV